MTTQTTHSTFLSKRHGRNQTVQKNDPIQITTGDKSPLLQVMSLNCESMNKADPQALAVTYWLDSYQIVKAGPLTIRFDGYRDAVRANRTPGDIFTVFESVDVVPGSGPISITAHIENIQSGTWTVTAQPLDSGNPGGAVFVNARPGRESKEKISSSGQTTFAPFASLLAPGVHPWAWPVLVGFGVVVAFIVQALLADYLKIPRWSLLALSTVSAVSGLLGAKIYYGITQYLKSQRCLRNLLSGACIQGFILGAVMTLVSGALIFDLPTGSVLDLTAPALMFAMAVGRYGCIFGGCCVGKPTSSRWGIWSSDRRVGVRRIPVQIFESTVALTVGIASLLSILYLRSVPGTIFVGTIAIYTLSRQLLFPLRDQRRQTAKGRLVVTLACLGVLLLDVVAVITLS